MSFSDRRRDGGEEKIVGEKYIVAEIFRPDAISVLK